MSSEPQENAGESASFLAFDKTNDGNNRGYRQNFHQYRPYNRNQNYRNQNFRRNQQQYQQFGAPQQNDDDPQFAPANYSSPVHHQQRFDNGGGGGGGGGGWRQRPNQQFQHRRNFVPFNVRHTLLTIHQISELTSDFCIFSAIRRWRRRRWRKSTSPEAGLRSDSTVFPQKYA